MNHLHVDADGLDCLTAHPRRRSLAIWHVHEAAQQPAIFLMISIGAGRVARLGFSGAAVGAMEHDAAPSTKVRAQNASLGIYGRTRRGGTWRLGIKHSLATANHHRKHSRGAKMRLAIAARVRPRAQTEMFSGMLGGRW